MARTGEDWLCQGFCRRGMPLQCLQHIYYKQRLRKCALLGQGPRPGRDATPKPMGADLILMV